MKLFIYSRIEQASKYVGDILLSYCTHKRITHRKRTQDPSDILLEISVLTHGFKMYMYKELQGEK